MIHLNLTPATRWGLNVVALLGVVVALRLGESIFIPLVLAVLLAGMLWPAANWLHQRLKLHWFVACFTSVSGLIALTLFVTFGFGLAITKMVQNVTIDPNREQEVYKQFRDRLEYVWPFQLDEQLFPEKAQDSTVFKSIKTALDPKEPYLIGFLWKVSTYGTSWVWQWILIMFILLFLLLEGKMLSRKVVEIVGPSAEAQGRAVEVLADMAAQVRIYLVWRTIVNFGLALVVGAVYYFLGLRQAWTWALLTAVLCYIPYIGPIIAGVPPIVDAFMSCPSPWYAVGVLIFYLAVIILEGYVIVPLVMGRNMELNATTVMLACLFWELVWGVPGLFLAMPLMAAIKAVCYHVPDLRPWSNLMSTAEPEAPSENVSPPEPPISISELDLKEIAERKMAERAAKNDSGT